MNNKTSIPQPAIAKLPDGQEFRAGMKFSKTKIRYFQLKSLIDNNKATEAQKQDLRDIEEYLPVSTSWVQQKRNIAKKQLLPNEASTRPSLGTTKNDTNASTSGGVPSNNSRGASDSVKQKKVTVGQQKQSEKKKAANVGINKQKKKKKEYAVDNRVQCRGIGNWRWRSW